MIKELSLAEVHQYDRIYTGLVTGVRLVGYESIVRAAMTADTYDQVLEAWGKVDKQHEAGQRIAISPPMKIQNDERNLDVYETILSRGSIPFEVSVLPLELLKGEATDLEILPLGGCGVDEPQLKTLALFLIAKSGAVNVIYKVDKRYELFFNESRRLKQANTPKIEESARTR